MILQGLYMIWRRVCRVFDDKQITGRLKRRAKLQNRLFLFK
jgi:hypothetical protein